MVNILGRQKVEYLNAYQPKGFLKSYTYIILKKRNFKFKI